MIPTRETVYLVFGDLHGRVLPAFRLALAWSREKGVPVTGLLQVGDLGYFPDSSRLDRATQRYAARDPSELGVQRVTQPNPEADALFGSPDIPEALWFTSGNHEDFEALKSWEGGAGNGHSFPVDAYLKVRCVRDGRVAMLPGGLRIGALWGVDPGTRRRLPPEAYIKPRSATALACSAFDVLLTHDGPPGAGAADSGSEDVERVIRAARPSFAFFGHYRGKGRRAEGDFGPTQVFHLAGMELGRLRLYPEEGCAGVLRWSGGAGSFEYLDSDWLLNFPRERLLQNEEQLPDRTP